MYYANVIMIESDSTRPWPCAAGGEGQTAQTAKEGGMQPASTGSFPLPGAFCAAEESGIWGL